MNPKEEVFEFVDLFSMQIAIAETKTQALSLMSKMLDNISQEKVVMVRFRKAPKPSKIIKPNAKIIKSLK